MTTNTTPRPRHASDPAERHPGVNAAVNAAFAATSLERTDHNLLRFHEGWNSSFNAYVGGPSRGDAWKLGRRAGLVYYGATEPLDTR